MSKTRVSPSERSEGEAKGKYFIFVKKKFNRKECHRFIAKEDASRSKDTKKRMEYASEYLPYTKFHRPICCCGEILENHSASSRLTADNATNQGGGDHGQGKSKWNSETDTSVIPTNAFGLINFESEDSRKPSKYVRLADDSNIDSVIELMRDYWHMLKPLPPHLAITVIGGAKNFELERKKKEIFERGLVKAAKSTNAWIITSGFNMGVMKAVGEAVSKGQTYNWDNMDLTHTLRCIGIGPWGYVEHRSNLEHKDDRPTRVLKPVKYRVNNVIRHGQPASLNPNHTHFLLVDDGVRGSYQGVANFRASLEKKISMSLNDRGLGIPVVLVLVEGGYDAIDDVHTSLENKIPVVLCSGTGRAADVIAYAYEHMIVEKGERKMRLEQQSLLKQKLLFHFEKRWASLCDRDGNPRTGIAQEYTDRVIECCKDDKLITVINMDKDHDELDVAILSALLKSQGKANIEQLQLALTWNRSDVAEDKLFNQENTWSEVELEKLITVALKEDKVNFVRLFLQNGVNMTSYLTRDKLLELYRIAPSISVFQLSLMRHVTKTNLDNLKLHHIAILIGKLMGKYEAVHYKIEQNETFEHPFRELLFWAIFMNRQEMALFLWEHVEDPIPSALVASWLFGALANQLSHNNSDLIERLEENQREFERLAVKVLEECNHINIEKASLLVRKTNDTWSRMTCLEMAAEGKNRVFLSTACCQHTLNQIWRNGVSSHWTRTLLGLIFPPALFMLLKFKTVYDEDTNGRRELSMKAKILRFYQAPLTKFAGNLIMYFIFLILYSFMILFDFGATISITEWVVLVWLFTMMVEELRDMLFSSNARRIVSRIHEWWSYSIFNRLDSFIFILAIIGFILRWFPAQFMAAKSIYVINGVLLFIRILREYSANSRLGPKLVMILTMLEELIFFISIFLVIILAYGVSSQAMMYPIRSPYALIFRDIFYFPYWSLFGQLFLDDMEGYTCINGTLINGIQCPTENWLVYVLTAVYLLIANILMLNTLIAIFNHVFEVIQANSIEIWKFGMYFLVMEYEKRPCLAPPFIIFEHVFLAVRWFINRCSCCCQDDEGSVDSDDVDFVLRALEKESCKHVLQQEKLLEKQDVTKKISFIETRMDEVYKMMEEDRLLMEHKQYGSDGRWSPRRLSMQHTTLSGMTQIIENNASELVTKETSANRGDETIVGPEKSDSRSKELRSSTGLTRMKRPEVPLILVTSDDGEVMIEDTKPKQRSRARTRRKLRSAESTKSGPAFTHLSDLDDAFSVSTNSSQEHNSWKFRIVGSDAEDPPPKLLDRRAMAAGVEPSQRSSLTAVSRVDLMGEAPVSEKVSALNDYLASVDNRMSSVEHRLIDLEGTARQSLSNIETLLRAIAAGSHHSVPQA